MSRGTERLGELGLVFGCVLRAGRTRWPEQVRLLWWTRGGQEGQPFSETGMGERNRFVGCVGFGVRSDVPVNVLVAA